MFERYCTLKVCLAFLVKNGFKLISSHFKSTSFYSNCNVCCLYSNSGIDPGACAEKMVCTGLSVTVACFEEHVGLL